MHRHRRQSGWTGGNTRPLAEISPLDGEDAFTYAWVAELLGRMLADVKTQCLRDDMAVHWNLFHERVLRPILEDRAPVPLAQLCTTYGIEEATEAPNMIFAVKRRFQSALTRHLRQSVACDTDLSEEIQELSRFLTHRRQCRK
jgi:hypothetical protein